MDLSLVDFSSEFLDLSFTWLHDDEIERLTNTPSFTREKQLLWYSQVGELNDYLIWGVEADSIKIGACGLKNITKTDCEYWGYIGEKDFWGRGIGSWMLSVMETKAWELGLRSLWLRVISDNKKAIRLYNKSNFITESEKDNVLFMRKIL